jgi:putative transposase
MFEKFKSNNNVVYSCKYHVIFCPKYRRKVLVNAVASRLKELLAQIAIDIKVEILEMEIMPDHVHLLIEVDPQFGVHKAVKRFKGATSSGMARLKCCNRKWLQRWQMVGKVDKSNALF